VGAAQLNPDESQLIAGALTLRHDSVFWRSVDGGRRVRWIFIPCCRPLGPRHREFAIARALSLAAIFGSLVLAGETIALCSGAAVARPCDAAGTQFFRPYESSGFHARFD